MILLGRITAFTTAVRRVAAVPADYRSTVGPRRMTAVRGFARYLAGLDPATEVPPLGLLPLHARWRGPFVLTGADIELIMNLVGGFAPVLRAATYVTLVGLLAATGLRIGEAIKLESSVRAPPAAQVAPLGSEPAGFVRSSRSKASAGRLCSTTVMLLSRSQTEPCCRQLQIGVC
jgi:hypothetical protein